ncbi:PhoX family phosphatase [Thioalkalicoccus limnaeus]|uniref:PhoX family phosphatase n=1 Tax=Thioalkalicoccus limnaeus TaxID=120681 RepID=A0ABV4BI31_9GAMM
MSQHFDSDAKICNRSGNPTIDQVIAQGISRRRVIQGGVGAAALAMLGPSAAALMTGAAAPAVARDWGLIGFAGIPVSDADEIRVPAGYSFKVIQRWGDPVSAEGPAFAADASQTWAEQARQMGMHHDGMHFFPLPHGANRSDHGLLVVNHEYIDQQLLHPDGTGTWTPDKVRKDLAAHGVSVTELRRVGQDWVVQASPFARRLTGDTPMRMSGPATGAEALRTAADPDGLTVLGTLNNCAHGVTPWGTYLACEENFQTYFVNTSDAVPPLQERYGILTQSFYRWEEHDERFDAAAHPNEPNRFGWVVEFDPYDPESVPVKRTALGRFRHESATASLAPDNRCAFYMGDDARFEYIYKFVTNQPYDPDSRDANRDLLDDGVLYVARFEPDGSGRWIALAHGQNGLTAENGFADQAAVLINARGAGDLVGATKMDRPEWTAVHPVTKDVYVTLTNNTRRGGEGQPGADAANPRNDNAFGHILRWREAGNDPTATAFAWEVFLLCGDPANPDVNRRGTIDGDHFAAPDGLWFDGRGLLWIQTDISAGSLLRDHHRPFGNNAMLAADPNTGAVRRFLTGPRGCEITGVIMTPDQRTLFINVQHPGEGGTSPANPTELSAWPDGPEGGRPRSATVVIWKADGGLIGT